MDGQKRLLKGGGEEICEPGLPMVGMISEEDVPSLYSLSLSDSMCSSSTVDLSAVEQSETSPGHDFAQPFHTHPLTNNFMEDNQPKQYEIHQNSTVESGVDMNCSLNSASRNCISLHDVSTLTPVQLPVNSTNTVSCETIHSQSLASKDSGFQRSVSCLSLNSGRRNYDHVESKVKAYIRNIKESEALRKKSLLAQKAPEISESSRSVEFEPHLDKEDLLHKVKELKDELHEKALFIDIQQRNYNMLLLKLAEAKNTINALRIQRISLNYNSTFEESQNTTVDNVDLGVFEDEIKKQQNNLVKSHSQSAGSNLNEKSTFSSLKDSNISFLYKFKPKDNSTPEKKGSDTSLSPVSKIFSSSSRLDKGMTPLAGLKKEKTTASSPLNEKKKSNVHILTPKKKTSKVISNSKSNRVCGKQKDTILSSDMKLNTTNIDLPNVDPFDKVKKWQASLPSINLLGSSDCEDSLGDSGKTRKLQKHDANYINCSLSTELMSKLKISNETQKSSSCVNITMYGKKSSPLGLKNLSVADSGTHFEIEKDVEKSKLNECPESQVQNLVRSSVPSTTESDSQTHLPKSSSWTCTSERFLKSDSSDSNDEDSSMSSSVLSSIESKSCTSSMESNTKFSLRKSKTEVRIPKSYRNKFTNTKVVLRKPQLNYEPMRNISNHQNDKILQKSTQSLNSSGKLKSLVESSQRKAWNERNNVNFYVCKEFNLKRSSSLQDCINIMQSMVQEGSSIIQARLEQSHCH